MQSTVKRNLEFGICIASAYGEPLYYEYMCTHVHAVYQLLGLGEGTIERPLGLGLVL